MSIAWLDLTVPDAETIRDFYASVVGWTHKPVPMGGYDDYSMVSEGETIAGICHARGPNVGIPAVWLPYFAVPSLDESLAVARRRGGEVLVHQTTGLRFAVVRDPAGAVAALLEKGRGTSKD